MELITKEDCHETLAALDELKAHFSLIISKYKPTLNGEKYLTGEEVCQFLKITKRTLQEYRDTRTIPYISIFGKMLYRESDLITLLEQNYIPKISYKKM